MKIIRLEPEDWEKYRAIRLEALVSDPQAFAPNLEKETAYPPEKWQERLRNESGPVRNLFIADDSGKIIGMAGSFVSEPGTAMIVGVYVTKSERGKGYATQLLQKLFSAIAKDATIKKLELDVVTEQLAAVALYKKMGFKVTGSMNTLTGDFKEHEEFTMSKPNLIN